MVLLWGWADMNRLNQMTFVVGISFLSWLMMMAVHELGHVIGAKLTGGNVERVVLHPLQISRTNVSPNPNPLIVVWAGPILGCAIPLLLWWMVPARHIHMRAVAGFFVGFCLIANGSYIAGGSFDRIGDCGTMLQSGSPMWTLLTFGAATVPCGFVFWHRLGSLRQFAMKPTLVTRRLTIVVFIGIALVVTLEVVLSGR